MISVAFVFVIATAVSQVAGHGHVFDPPSRSSMWRYPAYSSQYPPNYDDNALFCGGSAVQHEQNDGRCGLCGDNFADPTPRNNEDGGKYGLGVIAGTYTAGSQMAVQVNLTKAHRGNFFFSVCNLDQERESEECFDRNKLALTDGSDSFNLGGQPGGIYKIVLQVPETLVCQRCVLRWHYRTGNNWGNCDDGTQAVGCGPQETFRTCSDITIQRSTRNKFATYWLNSIRKQKLKPKNKLQI